jgi:hypothetical protein
LWCAIPAGSVLAGQAPTGGRMTMTTRLLTRENARWLVDELDVLVRTLSEDDVNLEALTTATRLLTSLEDAPGPRAPVQDVVQRLQAWSEVMFGDARHAGPGSIKATMLDGINELRRLIGLAGE